MFSHKTVRFIVVLLTILICKSYSQITDVHQTPNSIIPPDIQLGQPAAPGQYKAVVSIESEDKHIATGVLINEETVLTTALRVSVVERSNIIVRIGSTIIGNGTAYEVKSVTIHENFSTKNNFNDIALIQLKKTVPRDDSGRCIFIPIGRKWVRGNDEALAIAWGIVEQNIRSQNLQYKTVKVKPESLCLLDSRPVLINPLYHMCVQDDPLQKGFIQHDTGSPLIYNKELVGFHSFAIKQSNKAPVYVRTSYYYKWIQKKLKYLRIPDECK